MEFQFQAGKIAIIKNGSLITVGRRDGGSSVVSASALAEKIKAAAGGVLIVNIVDEQVAVTGGGMEELAALLGDEWRLIPRVPKEDSIVTLMRDAS